MINDGNNGHGLNHYLGWCFMHNTDQRLLLFYNTNFLHVSFSELYPIYAHQWFN